MFYRRKSSWSKIRQRVLRHDTEIMTHFFKADKLNINIKNFCCIKDTILKT